nr:retrovirus-related Pol polyprotein from transposon TNT 1-94 [Tanacetum cinerariifolium]
MKTSKKRAQKRKTEAWDSIPFFKRMAQPYQYASSSKQILKAKAKPFPPCTHYGLNDHRLDDCRNYPECEICRSYDHSTSGHNRVIHIRGGVLAESSQSNESSFGVKCNTCSSTVHSTSDHNEFDHFKRGEKIQAAKAREPSKKWQPGPDVVFGDNSSCITEGYGSINCGEPRINDVYVLDMSSLTPNGACFFAKASESVNWLWHKRLSHLNFKNISKLSKQNKVLGLPSIFYSKDKPCTTCEKGKHHRASFKTKQNFSIRKCLHRLHMDLFKPDHLGKFDAKADDGYFIRYSSISKAFRIYNTRRQQINEIYHVTFDESMEAIRFTNASVIEIGIDDSSRYPPDEFLHEDDPSRQYQVDSDISYYVIPHERSLTELTQENHVPEVIISNEHIVSLTEDIEDPPNLINTEGTHKQNV